LTLPINSSNENKLEKKMYILNNRGSETLSVEGEESEGEGGKEWGFNCK
jgi:hypothetical protein